MPKRDIARQLDVGGRKSQPRAAAVPPTTVPETRQKWPIISAAPATSPWASSARMAEEENTSPASPTWATMVTPKPCALPARRRASGSPARLAAETEIIADHDVTDAEAGHQDTLDKVLGGEGREGSIEGQNEDNVQSEALQQLQLARQRSELEVWLVRLKKLPRMRLKQQRPCRTLERGCPGEDLPSKA